MTARTASASKRADGAETLKVGPGVVQDHQRVAPVHLARRFSQIMLSVVYEAVPKPSARNEFGVLVAISQTANLDQKRLAAMMAIDATTIGQLLDILEGKGLIRRTVSPADRRVNIIEMTSAGRDVLAEYRPKVLKAQYDALSCLSERERTMLLELLTRVIEANPEHDRPGGGRLSPRTPRK